MATSIKITALSDIGANIAYTTIIPVVDMAGTPTTEKANLQIVGNLILSGAGGANFVKAAQATLAQTVTNAAQPNITSLGTLTSLTVSGNVTLGNITGNLLPNPNVTYNLGSATQRWNDIWLANSTIHMGDATISANGNSIIVDSITITDGNVGNIGNIASINLNGNASSVLLGDGTWGAGGGGGGLPLANGTSNFNIATANGNATITANGAHTWTFDNTGNLILPANSFAFKYANGDPIAFNQLGNFEVTGNMMMLNDANIDMVIQHSAADMTSIRLIPDGYPEAGVHIETGSMPNMYHWIFDDQGVFNTPGNVTMAGTRINIGPGSNAVPLTDPSIVAIGNAPLVQMALLNSRSNGSSDYIMYGAGGDETQGWAGIGFNGYEFDIPTFNATRPGDAGFFVQGYDSGIGGNLILATGDKGLGQDILFVLGGFTEENEFARISLSNNAFELNKAGAAFATPPSTPLTIQTPTVGVSGNTAEWDYSTPTLGNAKGSWQGTSTYADNVVLYTTVSDLNPMIVEFWQDEAHTIPYTLPSALFGAVGDFVYGTKAIDVTIRGGPAISNVRGIGGNIVLSANDGIETIWTFATDGNLYAPGNAILSGQEVLVGPGANTLGLADSTLVISSNSTAYLQAVINNVSDIGSADWVAQGHYGSDLGGYIDLGFNSSAFADPEFDITGPGDGYIFTAGYQVGQAPSTGGGNLILTTSDQGTTKDIIFGTGGFTSANIFGRISHANNALELSRENSSLRFADGTLATANLEGTGDFGFATPANVGFMIETNGANAYTWTFTNAGDLQLASGNSVISSLPNNAGDGSGLSTLNLYPDNSTGDDRYLILDPTGPSHLHLRAGGNIDASNVLLYLGGEQTYVQVDDGYHRVSINSYDAGNATGYNWRFDFDGNLVLPGNTFAVKYANGTAVSLGGGLPLANGTSNIDITTANGSVTLTAGGNTWTFDPTGNLTVPKSIIGNGNVQLDLGNTANEAYLTTTSDDSTALYMTAIEAQLYANSNVYINSLTSNVNLGANSDIIITSNTANANQVWTFGANGNLTLPGNTVAINFANGSSAFGNIVQWTTAPVANTSTGTPGQAAYDSGGNLYVCVAADTWAKFAGTTSW